MPIGSSDQEVSRSNMLLAPGRTDGAFPPTRGELRLAAPAATGFATHRDIPDPLGFADLAHRPDLTKTVIDRRLADGRMPRRVDVYPLPKKHGIRKVSCLDPYDDVTLRVLVGRILPALERLLDDSDVYSYPLATSGQGWTCVDHRRANRRRREHGRELLAQSETAGIGTFDVSNYYESIDPERLASQITGAAPGVLEALTQMLLGLPGQGGRPGLPIGFEGSGVLGNVFLLPADRVWARDRVGLIRWTDDTWLFLRSRDDWQPAVEEYQGRLELLGLCLNSSKSDFYDKRFGNPEEVMSSGRIDSIVASSGGPVPPDVAIEMLLTELESTVIEPTVVNFSLSCLRSTPSDDVPAVVLENPALWRIAPKLTGDVLARAAQDPTARRLVDAEALATFAATDTGRPEDLAGRLHAARAASFLRFGSQAGQVFHQLAMSKDDVAQVPLRAQAAVAWASSDHWKPKRAVEAAIEAGPLSLQRAFVAGFKHRADHRGRAKAWTRLRREDPDLLPTLAWAEV